MTAKCCWRVTIPLHCVMPVKQRAFIGSNSSLIAPVTIGADAIVGAGSAVSRDVGAGDLRVVRGEQSVKPGWADRFHDAMKKKKAAEKKD